MLQSAKPRVRYNERQLPEGQRFLDPATIQHRFYGMILTGGCLHPTFKDGEKVIFDQEAKVENGCFANFYYRPELVKPGMLGVALKKLIFAPPPWVTFPWQEHPTAPRTPSCSSSSSIRGSSGWSGVTRCWQYTAVLAAPTIPK